MTGKKSYKNTGQRRPAPKLPDMTPDASANRCRTCFWRGSVGSQVICDYMEKNEGKRRPCKPGEDCTVYIRQEKIKGARGGIPAA